MQQLPAYYDRNEQTVTDPDTVTTPTANVDLGSLPGAVADFGFNMAGQKLGVPGAVTSTVSAAAKTDSFSQLQDSLMSSIAGIIGREVAEAALPGIPGVASLTSAVASEATKSNPNFGAAAVSSATRTGAAMVGTALGGPLGGMLGGMLGGYAVKSSMDDGWLGDMTDARSREADRDRAESLGFSTNQTADAAGVDAARGQFGGIDPGVSTQSGVGLSPGLSDLDSGVHAAGKTSLSDTPSSAISNAAQGALGQFAGLDKGRFSGVDTSNDSEGSAMGDSGGRSQGDPDGDAGSDPN